MSLTRKALATMGIEEDKIDQIIEMHTSVTSDLKSELDKAKEDLATAKTDADKLPKVQQELEELKQSVEKQGEENPYKVKYDAIKEEFDSYKEGIENEKTKAKKVNAYKEALKAAGIADKRIDVVTKASGSVIDGIEFDDDGKVKDSDKLNSTIKEEWGDFIVSTGERGAKTPTPPANGNGTMSRSEIMKIANRDERRQAIANNLDAFGKKEGE